MMKKYELIRKETREVSIFVFAKSRPEALFLAETEDYPKKKGDWEPSTRWKIIEVWEEEINHERTS